MPVFASSSDLARQIESAAPADLDISANAEWMDYLIERNAIRANTRTAIAINALVLIAPKQSGMEVGSLSGPGLLAALTDARVAFGVPAGIYAKQALEHFGI